MQAYITVNLKTTNSMEQALTHGEMVATTKALGHRARSMDMALMSGLMGRSIMEALKMVFSTERAATTSEMKYSIMRARGWREKRMVSSSMR